MVFCLSANVAWAQSTAPPLDSVPARQWEWGGYVKDLRLLAYSPAVDQLLLDNLVHNRLNVTYLPHKHWRIHAGVRNRVFYGNLVSLDTAYGARVSDVGNDMLDLSALWYDGAHVVGHSMLDRLYIEFATQKWLVRLGRQRINWGINLLWNPNDVFNSYNFTDFDYEERPGSDALLVERSLGYVSSLSVGVKLTTDLDRLVAAARWKFNVGLYDGQLIAGYAAGDWIAGGGWAGNLGMLGFQGELTAFVPSERLPQDSVLVVASIGLDYMLPNGVFLAVGGLYNPAGTDERLSAGNGLALGSSSGLVLSAKNLYPYRYTVFGQASYPISPIYQAGLAVVFSPSDDRALFLNPTFSASITQSLDLDVIAQVLAWRRAQQWQAPSQAFFVRLKYSF